MTEPKTLLQTPDVRARIMHLSLNDCTPFHHHTEITDHMVCLFGRITIEMRDPPESVTLNPGGFCTIARGRSHRVMNADNRNDSRYFLLQGIGRYDFINDPD
jgi:mannose-6-phosphate isomerase-like protein (cupin superfamily)